MATVNQPAPNGLLFQIRNRDTLVPVLLTFDQPHQAREIRVSAELHEDLGVDRVAFVHINMSEGGSLQIKRLTDVGMFVNGDSTTAKRALDIIVREGRLMEFVRSSVGPLTGN